MKGREEGLSCPAAWPEEQTLREEEPSPTGDSPCIMRLRKSVEWGARAGSAPRALMIAEIVTAAASAPLCARHTLQTLFHSIPTVLSVKHD